MSRRRRTDATGNLSMTRVMTMVFTMPTVSKSQLKARMLAYFRAVEATGEPLIVTDGGRPVLRIVPIAPAPETVDQVFADVRGHNPFLTDEDPDAPTIDEWPQLSEHAGDEDDG
jgi:prevent-host-death family protein